MPPTDLITASSSAAASTSASGLPSMIYTSMPLTTIFTPPASCTDRPFTYFQDDGTTSTFWRDTSLADTVCYPYSYAYQHDPTVSAVYSPGVCPEDYYAAQYTANGPTGAQTSWCCPSGMIYGDYGCQSLVTSNTQVVDGSGGTITMTDPFIAVDWYIQVAWAQTNLNSFTPASAPVLTMTSTSASSVTSAPTKIALGASGPTKGQSSAAATGDVVAGDYHVPSSGLSTGAKAGIGVGVALGAIAVISLVAFFVLRKKRKNKWSAAPSEPKGGDNAYSQDAKYGPLHPQPAEVHEAADTSRPAEVQGDDRVRAEMQGSEYRPYRAELDGGQQARGERGKYT